MIEKEVHNGSFPWSGAVLGPFSSYSYMVGPCAAHALKRPLKHTLHKAIIVGWGGRCSSLQRGFV